MTTRDLKDIKRLFWINRYSPASLARLYGLSEARISIILKDKGSTTLAISETSCQLCTWDKAQPFYIDGDDSNEKPQNIIMLCETDRRRIIHLQLRRKVTPKQLESFQL